MRNQSNKSLYIDLYNLINVFFKKIVELEKRPLACQSISVQS